MIAARKGSTEVVSLLLKAGANTDLQNKVCHYVHIYTLDECSTLFGEQERPKSV